jgi:hypothetical protein
MNIALAIPQSAKRRLSLAALVLLLVTLLGACSVRLPPQEPLPDLHLPGVTQIPSVTTLHRGVGRGWIGSVATAPARSATSAPLALFSLDGDLYQIGFDGSDPTLIENICGNRKDARPASTTADGRWLLCDTDRLTLIPLPAAGDGETEHELHLLTTVGEEVMGFPGRVTISPDGRYLALLTDESGGCGVAFYGLSAVHDSATLVAFLTIPGVVVDNAFNGCRLDSPAWSPAGPDGSWLAFTRYQSGQGTGAVAFPLQPYLALIEATPIHPARFALDPTLLVELVAAPKDPLSPSWTLGYDGLRLNYITGAFQGAIEQVSLATWQTRTLLKIGNRGEISALAPLPDHHGLIFAHGTIPLCPDCQAGETPSHLYIYTPADA